MNLIKKILINIAIAVAIGIGLFYLAIKLSGVYTKHGDFVEMPDFSKKKLSEIESVISENSFEVEIIDSSKFYKEYKPNVIISQIPKPKSKVKKGRKVYFSLNSSGYRNVKIPKIINKSMREARVVFKIMGIDIGKKTYIPDIANDVILKVSQNGKKLNAGDEIKKHSKVDLTIGRNRVDYIEPSSSKSSSDKASKSSSSTKPLSKPVKKTKSTSSSEDF